MIPMNLDETGQPESLHLVEEETRELLLRLQKEFTELKMQIAESNLIRNPSGQDWIGIRISG